MTGSAPLLELHKVSKTFRAYGRSPVLAVDAIDMAVPKGQTIGLVGESGCGKSTFGRLIVGLLQPTGGRITFDGTDVTRLQGPALSKFRRQVQIVFQDPYSSLNPRLSIEQIVSEPLHIQRIGRRAERREKAAEMLRLVGISPSLMSRSPASLSGGQRQRVSIARSLVLGPRLLILDEPVSALDLSIQAQILDVLASLQESLGLTYLFISHDLSVVRHICDEVAVMYLGRLVEQGPTDEVFDNPAHPYSRALISAVPQVDNSIRRKRIVLTGDVPDPGNVPSGCAFHSRCWMAGDRCRLEAPALSRVDSGNVLAACHFSNELRGAPNLAPAHEI